MSLQVWLPFNGNLNNQGLSNVTVTNNGATVDNNGKIGKCYTFNNKYMTMPMTNLNAANGLTLACWVYPTANASGNTHLVTFAPGAGWSYNRFGLFLRSGTTSVITTASDGTNTINYSCQSSALALNTWTHVCSTYSNRKLTVYLNGVQNITYNIAFDISLNGIDSLNVGGCKNGNETLANCKLNDVRFYDHALSAKEIKEISKGLVLHYPLKGSGGENLLINSHFDEIYSVSSWNTTKNGSYCASSWGGYNGGVANPTSVYHAHLVKKDNDWVYNYHKTADENWLGIAQGGLQNKVVAGETYTFSCDLYRISGTNGPHGGFYTKANSSASNSFVSQFNLITAFTSAPTGQWIHCSQSLTLPPSIYMNDGCNFYIYGMSGGNGEFLMRRPKLERGGIVTPWIPNPADALYTALGYNNGIEYDCSGYGYNGTKTGTFSSDSTSPKYEVATIPTNNSTYIGTPVMNMSGFANSYTFSWWSKIENMSNKMAWGFVNGNRLNLYPSTYFCWNTGDGISNQFKNNGTSVSFTSYNNAWHHYAITGNGSTTILYIDGEEKGRATTYRPITGTQICISGWDTSTNYKWTNGSLTDFRLYSTALSADDIKELYQTSASIDKNGNVYCAEIKEV